MQTWICQFCLQKFEDPETLISHIWNIHQEDMSNPANRGKILLSAVQLILSEEDITPKMVIGLS